MTGPASASLAVHARRWLDLLLPPRCLGCGAAVAAQGGFCGACFAALRFITRPLCRICGYPLPRTPVADPLCGACLERPPAFARLRAALVYEDVARRMVLRFKHGGRLEGVSTFAAWMMEAGEELLQDAELLVPVPLHRWRLLWRGFNQSALLARALARASGLAVIPDLLLRTRATPSQQGLSAAARRENVTPAAFRIARRWRGRIEGRRLLLVDDVFTTGATSEACATTLLRGGAAAVDVLALARVVREESRPI